LIPATHHPEEQPLTGCPGYTKDGLPAYRQPVLLPSIPVRCIGPQSPHLGNAITAPPAVSRTAERKGGCDSPEFRNRAQERPDISAAGITP